MKEIAKAYDHNQVETDLYKMWEENGYFKPEVNPEGEPFSIIMPPPNSNGSLHLGHAVFITLEDLMTRFARLNGKAALWLPGADHAGFETQTVFEKKLEKEGKSRFDMSREELYQATLEFTLKNKEVMESQLKRLGASCDWDREKFTLDPDIVKIVYQTFVDLYNDGLAYRASRPVNWCTRHQTSLSDLEVKGEERIDSLYYIKYEELIVATTRPETLFGDVAVAVNPTDARYKKLIGKKVKLPLTDREIPVIADEMVDPKFGTGAVKITPAHDQNDFEAGKRHGLEIIEVIDQYGRMNDKAGEFKGMKINEAREKVVQKLQSLGLIDKIDANYNHTVNKCYKCNTVIEPRILPQWFIAVNKKGEKSGKILAKDALDAVDAGKTKFVTEKFEKIYRHWMNNIRDWNISRQIVWGIQLPVYYRKNGVIPAEAGIQASGMDLGSPTPSNSPSGMGRTAQATVCNDDDIYVGIEPPKDIENWERDPDVFDTWFSSGQWPFATLKTTKDGDFKKFYPTTVMETGWDILFFWVARMMMLGLYITGEVPFKNVYLHGLVRDKDRQKMSKSKGNVIDPLGVADLYGSDAVRMALVFGTSAGSDAVISEEKIRGMRNFSNKIWNASRFTILRVTGGDVQTGEIGAEKITDLVTDNSILTDPDKKILKRHSEVIKSVTKNIEKYNFSMAAEEIYAYFWHDFCDNYIEQTKKQLCDVIPESPTPSNSPSGMGRTAQAPVLDDMNKKVEDNTKKILIKILSESLQMLHPFMPYVTEAVWQELRNVYPDLKKSITISRFPGSTN